MNTSHVLLCCQYGELNQTSQELSSFSVLLLLWLLSVHHWLKIPLALHHAQFGGWFARGFFSMSAPLPSLGFCFLSVPHRGSLHALASPQQKIAFVYYWELSSLFVGEGVLSCPAPNSVLGRPQTTDSQVCGFLSNHASFSVVRDC